MKYQQLAFSTEMFALRCWPSRPTAAAAAPREGGWGIGPSSPRLGRGAALRGGTRGQPPRGRPFRAFGNGMFSLSHTLPSCRQQRPLRALRSRNSLAYSCFLSIKNGCTHKWIGYRMEQAILFDTAEICIARRHSSVREYCSMSVPSMKAPLLERFRLPSRLFLKGSNDETE